MKSAKYSTVVVDLAQEPFGNTPWFGLNKLTSKTDSFAYANLRGASFPRMLYANDFNFDLPLKGHINQVTVSYDIYGKDYFYMYELPDVYFNYGESFSHWSEHFSGSSMVYFKGRGMVSESVQTVSFTIKNSDIGNILTPEMLMRDTTGIMLKFMKSKNGNVDGKIYVANFRIEVDYDVSEYHFFASGNTIFDTEIDANNNKIKADNTFTVTLQIENRNEQDKDTQEVVIDTPFSVEWVDGSGDGVFDFDNDTWITPAKYGHTDTYYLTGRAKYMGIYPIDFYQEGLLSLRKYIGIDLSDHEMEAGHNEKIRISQETLHKKNDGKVKICVNGVYDEGNHDFYLNFDDGSFVDWDFENDINNDKASFVSKEDNKITIHTPDTEVKFYLIATIIPYEEGILPITFVNTDTTSYDYNLTIVEPYETHILLKTRDVYIHTENIATQVETDAYILPCGTTDRERNIIISKSSLTSPFYYQKSHIGPIFLDQTNYSPKTTYKDNLLDTTYKNKRYLGKECSPDETISLDIRLHPYQVTTLHSLIDMDKPVPINTNPQLFEGDVLAHRGWAEIYGNTVTKTNPSWYDCSISVKYLNHKDKAVFNIIKGNRINDYDLPNILTDKAFSGDRIDYVLRADTGGSYYYNEGGENLQHRNMFILPNGTGVTLRSKEILNYKSQNILYWDTSRITENTQNNMTRIVKLVDDRTGNSIVEYEYFDFEFDTTNVYKCRVICRVKDKASYKVILNKKIQVHSDIEYNGSDGIDTYGSELSFNLVGNKLSIRDGGLNGNAVSLDDIDIEPADYKIEVEFKNNNTSLAVPDIICYFDYIQRELTLGDEYGNYYENLIASPFLIPGKEILFIRDCYDGPCYYLIDDGKPFTQLLSPYFQYQNGVDLQNSVGSSIVNLENDFDVIYMSNGLVKLGINRWNGRMYVFRYDSYSRNYIEVGILQLSKFEDLYLELYDYDKMVLIAGETTITMWRGRPWIEFKHPTEDINILTNYGRIYSNGVGYTPTSEPTCTDLVNKTNMLPPCLGSINLIDPKCMEVYDLEKTMQDNVSNIDVPSTGTTSNPVTFTYFDKLRRENDNAYLVIDGELLETPLTFNNQGTGSYTYNFKDGGTHTVQMVACEKGTIPAFVSEIYNIEITDDTYKLELLFDDIIPYQEQDFKVKLTLDGTPIQNETIIIYAEGVAYDKLTNNEGIATLPNNLTPRETVVRAEFYDVIEEESRIAAEASKEVTIVKAQISVDIDSTEITRHSQAVITLSKNDVPLTNTNFIFNICGKDYPRITNANGEAALNINLLPGNYDLNAIFPGTGNYEAITVVFEIQVSEEE